MKRKDLVRLLERNGYTLRRNGGDHDIYSDGKTNMPVPRHKEINELLSESIIKRLGLK